eukprot:TRINITY_DN9898_c0_g3_i1.p1 TRINITY_DN9898_c0_g3~~TRINITY_DN9898_c0_g3_i1.p1  ORF type:complete len:875 (+),score=209.98 TRINITY_DN9898_c0_g3_i1:2-2626(+)
MAWRCVHIAAILAIASSKLLIPSFFGDNMVLQTNNEFGSRSYIWGWANAGEEVTISLNSSKPSSYVVTGDEEGFWKVTLNPHTSSRIQDRLTLTVETAGGESVSFNNIVYGDVFLCSGQSNMVFPLKLATNASQFIGDADNYPYIRTFQVSENDASSEQRDIAGGQWNISSSANIGDFSAVCYLAALEVAKQHTQTRPLGLIQSAVGGTHIEPWMSPKALARCPENYPPSPAMIKSKSVLWNGMIAPLIQLAMRGVYWYQGEANAASNSTAQEYGCLLNSMIQDWRERQGYGDFSFVAMQLPPSVPPSTDPAKQTGRPEVRAGEATILPRPDGPSDTTGMAVGIDMGGSSAWGYDHPPNKGEMGRRLGLQMLHTGYALQQQWGGSLRFAFPQVDTVTSTEGNIRITLQDWTAEGLRQQAVANCTSCCATSPFEVFDGHTWSSTGFSIDNITIVLDKAGESVRYAWTDFVQCVVMNQDDLPMGPFWINITTTQDEPHAPRRRPLRRNPPIQKPPMGFNSWNAFHCNIDENVVRATAQAMIDNGMQAAGYEYVNIDDCWQAARQFANQTIVPDPVRFPSGMAKLADDIHALGMKFGVYTARGTGTCQSRPGSYGHELVDAATYCDWGLDYIKIDVCHGAHDPNASWSLFHQGFTKCFRETNQYIVMSVETCDDPSGCGQFVTELANLWRTYGDIQTNFASVMVNIKANDIMADLATPGHFNDPDMLQVGNPGLSFNESLTHFALWCVTSAPLLAGTDVVHASNETLAILTAPELITINQDLGVDGKLQGKMLQTDANATSSVWVKTMSDHSLAIVLVNEGDSAAKVTVNWQDLGLPAEQTMNVRDAFARTDIGQASGQYSVVLDTHASQTIRLTKS